MKFVDAFILANTKRKTRRIRTALVVIISALLFAVLFGAAFVAQGVINAGKQVGDVGFNSRHLASVYSVDNGKNFDYEAQSKKIEGEMVAELKARKIKVTDQTKQDAAFQIELSTRMNKLVLAQYTDSLAENEANIRKLGNPSGLYHFASFPLSQSARYQPDTTTDPLAEDIKNEQQSGGNLKSGYGNPNEQMEFSAVESDMMRTQVYPGQTLGWKAGDPYPLIVSYGYLEKLSGKTLTNLPAKQRNAGYRELIKKYAGQELNYCYRNSTAQEQLRAVVAYNKIAESDNDAHTKSLDLPICGGFDQKNLQKLGIISDEDPTGTKPLFPLPVTPAPDTANIRFKISGFVPSNTMYGSTDAITSMLTNISSLPTAQYPGIIPKEVIDQDQRLKQVAEADGGSAYAYSTIFVDFNTKAEQKAFLAKGCTGSDCSSGKAYIIAPFGNIVVALEGLFKFVSKALFIAALVIMVIAGLMIMLTISKVIADSTKEIAVFRSLGARRRDIAHIYYTYGTMLAASSLVFALVLAITAGYVATTVFDDRIAQGLIQATGAYNSDVKVVLLGINTTWLFGIIGALFAAAAIGIGIPVLASIRRKLITILREE